MVCWVFFDDFAIVCKMLFSNYASMHDNASNSSDPDQKRCAVEYDHGQICLQRCQQMRKGKINIGKKSVKLLIEESFITLFQLLLHV